VLSKPFDDQREQKASTRQRRGKSFRAAKTPLALQIFKNHRLALCAILFNIQLTV
jgi:hypothetical protein